MLPRIAISFFTVLVISCNNKAVEKIERDKMISLKTIEEEGVEVSLDSLKLNENIDPLHINYARNIGEFFDHRLKFFAIDKPNLKINQTPVNKIVLYFVDSTLARVRYQVNEEVGSYLLDSLGLSKFKPLDSLSKALLKKKKVYDRFTSKLNPDMHNYELIWRNHDSVKRYRVKSYPDSLITYYFYEEVHGYKKKVRELESMYSYLEHNAPVLN